MGDENNNIPNRLINPPTQKITEMSTLQELKSILNDESTKKILNNTKLDNENLYRIININLVSEIVQKDEVNVVRNNKMCNLNNDADQCNKSSIGCKWENAMCSEIKTNVDNQLTGVKADDLCKLMTVNDNCDLNYNLDKDKIKELSKFENHREDVLKKLRNITKDKNNINNIIDIINNQICLPLEYFDSNDNKCKPLITKCLNNDMVKDKLKEKNCVNINTTEDTNEDNSLEEINKNIIPKICNKRNNEKCEKIDSDIDIDECITGKRRNNNNKVCISKNCYKRNLNVCNQKDLNNKDNDICGISQNICKPICSKYNKNKDKCIDNNLCRYDDSTNECHKKTCNSYELDKCEEDIECVKYNDTDNTKCIPNCNFTVDEFNYLTDNISEINNFNENKKKDICVSINSKLNTCQNDYENNSNMNIYNKFKSKCPSFIKIKKK